MSRLVLVTLVGLGACASPATQLVVVVDSDLPADVLTEVTASVHAPDGRLLWARSFSTQRGAALPLSFGVLPIDDDPDVPVTVELRGEVRSGAEGLTCDPAHALVRRAVTRPLRDRALVLRMVLAAACLCEACDDPGDTCTERGCAPAAVDPEALPGLGDPGSEVGARYDAGLPPPDAGLPDSGVPICAPDRLRCREGRLHACDPTGTVETASTTCPTSVCRDERRCFPPSPPGFVTVARGTFDMGSPSSELGRSPNEVLHQVTLTRDFWLAETELTQGEWLQVIPNNPSGFQGCGLDCPVERVDWFDAVTYLNARSRAEGLPPCYDEPPGAVSFFGLDCLGYRLPTEAEWEYAARAGSQTPYANGANTATDCGLDPNLDLAGWYCGNSATDLPGCVELTSAGGVEICAGTHPVRAKAPNAWGLFDLHGNVWEWVTDGFAPYPDGAVVDPIGPDTAPARTLRGGSWGAAASQCRSALRSGYGGPSWKNFDLGFRVARTIP